MLKGKAIQLFQGFVKNMNGKKIKQLVSDPKRIYKIANLGNAFREHLSELKLMVSLLQDVVNGSYKTIPKNTVFSIAGVITYIVIPTDAVPDVLPALGLIDDLMVYQYALKFIRKDLENYRLWLNPVQPLPH
jgi:uncharacterized membrane protein YkvA (DUF1232 family)